MSRIRNDSYSYDLAGNLAQITYPSGRSVTYQLDGLGRVTTVTTKASPTSNPVTLASNVQYLPFGPMSSLKLGNNEQVDYTLESRVRVDFLLEAARGAAAERTAAERSSRPCRVI